MISQPLVTIICSCFNHQDFVVKTLNSVKEQIYQNIELIVVDDGSKDNSVSVIKDWLLENPKVRLIENKENLGLTKSFNNAMTFATGAYYMDLAADDILLPKCVDELVKAHLANPEIGIVFSNAETIDSEDQIHQTYFDKNRIIKIKKAIKNNNYYETLLKKSDIICSVSAMFRSSLFKELGGYDENLYFEDLDFWLRVSRTYSVFFTDLVLVQKRFLKNSMGNGFFTKSNHTKKLHISFYYILKKAYSMNTKKTEFLALIPRIYKQSRWAIKTLNFKYLFLYALLFLKTICKITFSFAQNNSNKKETSELLKTNN